MTATPDQDQAAARLDPDAQLDLLDAELARRRREREAAAEQAEARAYICSRCGVGESWRTTRGRRRGWWLHDDRGPVCSACDLDRRSFQRPDGAIIGDSEHRARVIAELIGEERARYVWAPLLVARAPELLRWWGEVPGAEPGERFGYVDREALAASLVAPPPPPPVLVRGPVKRCPACGAKGEVWTRTERPISGQAYLTGDGVTPGYIEVTWTCHGNGGRCRHVEVQQRYS